MLDQPTDQELRDITTGDYPDNCEVDIAYARRLLLLCRAIGDEGRDAETILEMALRKIDVDA